MFGCGAGAIEIFPSLELAYSPVTYILDLMHGLHPPLQPGYDVLQNSKARGLERLKKDTFCKCGLIAIFITIYSHELLSD